MPNWRRFAMDHAVIANDLCPESLTNRLVSKADAHFAGGARPGRQHHRRRPGGPDSRNVDLVVSKHLYRAAQLSKILDEIVGKRVVIIDQQQSQSHTTSFNRLSAALARCLAGNTATKNETHVPVPAIHCLLLQSCGGFLHRLRVDDTRSSLGAPRLEQCHYLGATGRAAVASALPVSTLDGVPPPVASGDCNGRCCSEKDPSCAGPRDSRADRLCFLCIRRVESCLLGSVRGECQLARDLRHDCRRGDPRLNAHPAACLAGINDALFVLFS